MLCRGQITSASHTSGPIQSTGKLSLYPPEHTRWPLPAPLAQRGRSSPEAAQGVSCSCPQQWNEPRGAVGCG